MQRYTNLTKRNKKTLTTNDFPINIDLSELNVGLGSGYCGNVFKYQDLDGDALALKCCDSMNNRSGF